MKTLWVFLSIMAHTAAMAWAMRIHVEPVQPKEQIIVQVALLTPSEAAPAQTQVQQSHATTSPRKHEKSSEPAPEPSPIEQPSDAAEDNETTDLQTQESGGGTARTTVTSDADPDRLSAYTALIRTMIDDRKHYPLALRRARIEGKAVLAIVVRDDGHVATKRVIHSSGHGALDQSALQTMDGIDKFPSPPQELHWGSERELHVPISYNLYE